MTDHCCFCKKEITGFHVTAGRNEETGEPQVSCPLCWDARHPPWCAKTFQEVLCRDIDVVGPMIERLLPYLAQREVVDEYNRYVADRYLKNMQRLSEEATK
jgi:hypothetical protein